MRVAAVLGCFGLRVSAASAGPGVIAASRVEALDGPSNAASVVLELMRGAPVCVLDDVNYPRVVQRRLGWLAIRLPRGVGYVPAEAVDLAAPANQVADCRASATGPEPQVQAPDPEPAPKSGALIARGFLPLHPARLLVGLGTGASWINKRSAAEHQIDDSGATINGTLGLTIYDVFMVSGSVTGAFPSDHFSFTQEVTLEMGGGSPHSADSSLSVTSYSIAAGLRTPFWVLGSNQNGRVAGALFAEYGSAGIHGTRSISNCVDCRKDELDMPGGTFWQVGFDLLIPSSKSAASYGLTVGYQRYEAGAGFTQELRVGFSCWLL